MTTTASFRSKLVTAGELLLFFAFFGQAPLEQFLVQRFRMTLPLALAIDESKSSLFVGPGLLLIGLLRERQAKNGDKAGR